MWYPFPRSLPSRSSDRFTFHTLRHTLGNAFFSWSEYPKVIQSLLGLSSITQTMDRYSHLLEDLGGDAVEGLDESFG